MNLTIGNIEFSLARRKASSEAATPPRQTIPSVVSIGTYSGQSRAYYNAYDAPRMNLLYIRETVSSCMHARSEAISHGELHAYRLDNHSTGRASTGGLTSRTGSKLQLDAKHPLEALLRAPNPILDMSDILELTSQWLDATGNAILLKVRDQRGIPRELWPIAALSYQIEKGEDGMPQFYRFQPTNTLIPVADIIHIRRPDLRTAPFYGHAILSDLLDTAKADTAVRLFQERYFANDAVPRAVLKWPVGSLLSQDQMNQIRNAWEERYGGPSNGGKLALLPDGGEIDVLSGTGKELDFRNSKQDLSDAIRQAFKVPKVVLGEVDGVNLANADTSYSIFMRDVVDASLSRLDRALTRSLAREFGSDIHIEHDNILPESEAQMLGRLAEVKQTLTVNEQRALLDLPPLPDGRGNVFMIGNTIFAEDWTPL